MLMHWGMLGCIRGHRTLAVGLWIAAALPMISCRGGCGHEQGQPVAAQATAAVLSMKPLTDWGQVHTEHKAANAAHDLYTVAFESAASLPIQIEVPKGVQLKLDALPPDNTAKPLEPSKYRFELTPSETKASGFQFTAKDVEGGPFHLAVTPSSKPNAYDIEVALGSAPSATRTTEVCAAAGGIAPALARSNGLLSAVAALSAELTSKMSQLEAPDRLMRVVVGTLGRAVDVQRLTQAAHAQPCPATASLEFICDHPRCRVKLSGVERDMKQGDYLSLASGASVEFMTGEQTN
ncbi:MAG TPA: hypothetical protein VGD37_04035 [Kofleriaceae bacterium]